MMHAQIKGKWHAGSFTDKRDTSDSTAISGQVASPGLHRNLFQRHFRPSSSRRSSSPSEQFETLSVGIPKGCAI